MECPATKCIAYRDGKCGLFEIPPGGVAPCPEYEEYQEEKEEKEEPKMETKLPALNRNQIIHEPNLLEKIFIRPQRLGMPEKGYHTLYTRHETLEDGSEAIIAYLVGGGNNGDRYSVVAVKNGEDWRQWEWGSTEGFRFPVIQETEAPWNLRQDIEKACTGLREYPLLRVDEVPGFSQRTPGYFFEHRHGWYTRSVFTYEYSPNVLEVFGPGARAFPLREGLYVAFPDGTYRLIPLKTFWEDGWAHENPPTYRQGDLLVWATVGRLLCDEEMPVENLEGFDRHEVRLCGEGGRQWKGRTDGDPKIMVYYLTEKSHLKITHPQHDTVIISEPGWWKIQLLPGTSRPFQRTGGVD